MTNVKMKVSTRFSKYNVTLFLVIQKRVINCMGTDEEKQKVLKAIFRLQQREQILRAL